MSGGLSSSGGYIEPTAADFEYSSDEDDIPLTVSGSIRLSHHNFVPAVPPLFNSTN